MPLLKLKGFTSDDWQLLGSDDPLPSCGDIAIPWARLVSEWDNLVRHDGRLGVMFPNNEKVNWSGSLSSPTCSGRP